VDWNRSCCRQKRRLRLTSDIEVSPWQSGSQTSLIRHSLRSLRKTFDRDMSMLTNVSSNSKFCTASSDTNSTNTRLVLKHVLSLCRWPWLMGSRFVKFSTGAFLSIFGAISAAMLRIFLETGNSVAQEIHYVSWCEIRCWKSIMQIQLSLLANTDLDLCFLIIVHCLL